LTMPTRPFRIAAVIPARMGSSRFPGKPLASLLGRPMIEHVYRRTAMCRRLDEVIVATCDGEILKAVEAFGGNAVMTSSTHQRASDRVAEAMKTHEADIVVMVQGDEPMTYPEMIDAALDPFQTGDEGISCVNLVARIATQEEFQDPNTIKVVMDTQGFALYMSREPVPTRRIKPFTEIPAYKQVCIIPFTAEGLREFSELPPTPLEVAESIDMLRFIEHGRKVKLVETKLTTHAVDTPDDLRRVEWLLRQDPLTRRYLKDEEG
jgi:3-deoxy-manno-octulosonate cytidylyltransferase (CMP-KDO synthetase)